MRISDWSSDVCSSDLYIDMTLYDCGLSLMHPYVANYTLSGRIPQRTGNQHPNISPYDLFPTKTVDIFVAGGNDRAFKRLCVELGQPELGDDQIARASCRERVCQYV